MDNLGNAEGFIGTARTFLIFYRYLRRYKIADSDIQTKKWILGRLAKQKKAKFLRELGPVIQGKNILKINYEDYRSKP
jgi:hypothetical protein